MNDCTAGHAIVHGVLWMLSASISDFSSSTVFCTEWRPRLETAHVFMMLFMTQYLALHYIQSHGNKTLNYFKIISATLNMLENIHELQ